MKKFLIALVLLAGIVFLLARLADLEKIMDVLQKGKPLYLLLALAVQVLWMLNLGAFFQSVYRVLGMEEKRFYLFRLTTAANFLTIIAPSAGLSAMAIYLADARRNGRSQAKVTVAGAMYVWFEYLGTLIAATLGLAELAHRNSLHWPEIAASLVLVAGALGMAILFFLGMESAAALGRTLAWMARAVNRVTYPFIKREYLQVERAYSFSSELSEGISALRSHSNWVIRPLFFALLNKALLMVVMVLCFLAFNIPVDLGVAVAGLGLAQLFLIVSPTPAGVGIVEGVLAVALTSLGVAVEDATVVSLSYRSFVFWLPFLVGMISFRTLARGKKPLLANPQSIKP